MKSPIFFSKGRTVRFWIQIVLVLALVQIALVPSALYANPTGEQVVGGVAGFNRPDAATLIVNQNTDRAVINWNSFSIANGELTKFVQPSSSSAVLNRVVTANPSAIYGTLEANGSVFLINPGGVLVGAGGVVNTASFVASTHDINSEEFMKGGQMHLNGNSDASVINQGNITAREGDVFLIAKEVKNEGQLMAKDGTVGMVSGTEVSLQAVGQGNYKVRLLAAETDPTSPRTSQSEGGASKGTAEIVNEGVIQAANAVLEAKGSYLPMAIKNTGVIEATGLVENGDGSVTLTGGEGDILNSGVVAALQRSLDGQRETGGSIMMTAKNVTSDLGSVITASGKDGGGSVKLRSADTTILRGSIEVVGASESAKGGKVQLLGERVGLFDRAKVDASGGAGGGQVLVGGDYLGKNPDVPNAKAVVMGSEAKILADAKVSGDGGKVILWSDEYTAFFGDITALGGKNGGNGGFVETSSANNLQAFGAVNASAKQGNAGLWLLDPQSITITTGADANGSFSGGNPDVFTPDGSGVANVQNTQINDALNLGTSVTIQTGNDGNEYTITLNAGAPIQKTLDNAATLTLLATGGITLNSAISSTSNELYMVFNADVNNDGGVFTSNSALTSNGGNIAITASEITISAGINTRRTLTGGGQVAGNILFNPSLNGSNGRLIQVGGVKAPGSFVIDQTDFNNLTLDGSVLSGTVTIGDRAAGNITLLNGASRVDAVSKNVTLRSGGTILDNNNTATFFATTGLLTLSAAGNIGGSGAANVLNLSVPRLAVISEGDLYNVSTTAILTQFNVTTDGTVASQAIRDNSALSANLNFSVTESATTGNTTINTLSVNASSVDFYYENTGLGVQGGGDITIGAASLAPVGIRNVQAATNGYSSLLNIYRDLEIRSTRGTLTVNTPIFSGGGNITLAALDFVGIAPDPLLPATAAANPNDYFASAAVINTFRSTSAAASPTATFGTRQALQGSLNGISGAISGQGGMLTLEPTSQSAAGRDVVLSRVDASNIYPNTFNLSWDETTMLEAPAIRIGGTQTGDIRIQPLNEFAGGGVRNLTLTTINTAPTANTTTTVSYVPRYFEQPFFDAERNTTTPRQPSSGSGVPHVSGGFVSFVSALGEVRNLPGGDVNIGTLSLTGVDGVFFDGRGGGNYAETDGATATGSLVGSMAGRVGRTIQDITVGSGGDYTVYLPVSGIDVEDARNVTGVSSLLVPQTAAAAATLTGGAVSALNLDTVVSSFSVISGGSYAAVPDVTLSGGGGSGASATANMGIRIAPATVDNGGTGYTTATVSLVGGGGSGATATATLTAGAVTAITITSSGSGYTDVPEIVIDGDGTGAAATLAANPLTLVAVNLLSPGTGYTSAPTVAVPGGAVLAAATSATRAGGGGSYTASPVVTLYGGGIQLGSARALLDEATVSSSGTSGVVSVVPQIIGSGYTSAPTVTITDPLGIGSGATATAFINLKGQLTPFDVSALGDGYTAPPTVTLTGGVGSGAVARAEVSGYVKQSSVTLVGGTGYTSTPTVTISGGNGFGATATATVDGGGVVTAITITDPGYGYTAAPVITISGGGGTGASATVKIGQGVTGLYIVDSGSGYTSAPTVTLSGGGGSGAVATFNPSAGFFPAGSPVGLSPIRVTASGSGYTTAPEVSLSGGEIAVAQARAIFDNVPTSATFGQVRGYEITDPGAGYKSAPFVSVGSGTAFGNFGEYGVSTEQVDRNRASGNIVLDAFDAASQVVSGLVINAPVRTGNAYGVNGTSAITGSILLDAGTGILANSDRGADGVVITGDAVVTGGSGSATTSTQSGSITLGAYSIANTDQSALQRLSGSLGLPVQIGTASGGNGSNLVGALQAALFDRTTAVGVGNLQIYAPAPGQIEAAQGGLPLDPNHSARPPRASNDLALSGLATEAGATDALGNALPSSSLVTVEVGGQDGKLTLQRYANSSATATINDGQVTLITPNQGGALYTAAPTVEISGGGVVQAEGSASISGGQVTGITVANAGSGYGNNPSVTITGGGGSGATATATIANGVVTGITMVNKGFGYTSLPIVTLGPPSGTPATATAVTGDVDLNSNVVIGVLGIQSINVTSGGTGYLFAPTVTITDSFGLGQGASAVANVSNGTVTSITVTAGGLGYVQPVITIGDPAGIAQATANLTDGTVTSFTITDPGGGYASVPQVRLLTGGTDPYNLDTDRVGLFADRIQIFDSGTPSSLQITASVASIAPFTNQRPVNLGTLTVGSTSFQNSDISRFAVDSLVVGRRQADQPSVGAGVITVSQPLSYTANSISGGVVLAGTRGITDIGGTSGLSFENVVLDAGGTVSLTGSGNSSQYFSGIIRDSGLAAGASFSVSSSLKTSGTSILPFTIGEVFVDASEFTGQRFYQGITTQDGDISVFANQIQQTPLVGFLDTTGGGTIPVSTSTVTLAPLTAGTAINIYSTTQASGSLGLRIGNAQNPGLELVRAKSLVIGSSSAGAITLNSNLEFNYLQYPQAPFQVSLISGSTGSITAGTSQSAGAGISRIRVGALSITDAGTISLSGANDVDELAATITGSGSLSFTDIDGIRLGAISVANALTITAGTITAGAITQTTDGITVGGVSSFSTSTATGGQGITLTTSSNNFGGAVNLSNAGPFNVAVTDANALTLGTLAIPSGNLTVISTGALNLGAGTVGGNLSATSNGGAISQTGALAVTGASSIEAGAAPITLANTSNNFGGTVTLSQSGAANGITLSDGTGNLTIGNITSAGAVSITASGTGGTLLFGGTYDGPLPANGLLSGSLTATAVSSTGNVNLTFNSGMTAISSATLQTDGTFTVGAGANLGNSLGVPATTTTTSISVTADSLAGLGASLTAQSITLQPFNTALSLGLNNAVAGFNVPANLLTGGGQRIFARDSLILGSPSATGGITIGNNGITDLSSQSYGLTLRGLSGGVTFANTLILPNDTTFDLSVGTSDVNGGGIPLSGIAVSIGGTGTISFGSVGNVNSFTGSAANLGASNVTGNLNYTSVFVGNLNVGQMSVGGTSSFTLPAGGFTAVNAANAFTGSVTLAGAAGLPLGDVAITNSKPLTLGSLNIGGNFTATGAGISGGAVAVTGNTTLTGGTGDVTLTDSGNSFVGSLSVVSSLNTSLFVSGNQLDNLGAVQATRNFALTTDAGTLTLPTAVGADNQLSSGQIQNFNVGSLSLTADSILVNNDFNFSNIQTLSLSSTAGAISATQAITAGNLSLNSTGGGITLGAGNRIANLGSVASGGNFTLVNVRGLNLAGSVTAAGNTDLTVAGQFYNTSGQATPFAGTTGRAVVRSLSMMGGLPNQISALAGFTPSYNFTDPGTSRAMIYAVSPLAQFAPSGTTIAGVNLSGAQTGGGQFNTFLTGSDNLNWMISDFGRFDMPTVKPSGMDYILYPQRVEPETRTLPAATMGQLERELGRPPTLEEIQAREVAAREAVRVRSGAILDRSSFDAVEDEVDKQESAEAPAQVIDGGKPQAGGPSFAPSPASAGGASEGFGPQARKSQSVRQGANGPILRSGPIRSVAQLRPAEPAEGASAGKITTQAANLDAKSVMEQERASAEVGIAPPIAAGR
jgi:filamentous hemagglutinin family protein